MSIAEMKWTRQPADYRIEPGRIEITTEPHTDLWQRTYYHFRNDNAPVLQYENLYYKGSSGSARAFAEEMESSGIAADIRAEKGNLHYQYFQPLDDPETILLIDSCTDQDAIDVHHASPMMAQLAALREKYDLHMTVERYVSEDIGTDERFIRK